MPPDSIVLPRRVSGNAVCARFDISLQRSVRSLHRSLGRMRVSIILGLAVWVAFSQESPTFRTGVALVQVDAEVTAADGRTLTGFHKEDFRVFDEGAEQPIVQFSWAEEPLDLILLFDISGSMR